MAPVMSRNENAEMPYDPEGDEPEELRPALRAARGAAERELLTRPGVTGVGIGVGPTGDDVIVAYVRTAQDRSTLPKTIAGVAVVAEVTGDIDAL